MILKMISTRPMLVTILKTFFTGRLYTENTLEFNKVNRSLYRRGTDSRKDIVESLGKNCYIPPSGNCFVKCINYLTGLDYTNELLIFIEYEQRRSDLMTSARVQPFCKEDNIKIRCYDGFRVRPRSITERNIAFYMHKNNFNLFWK